MESLVNLSVEELQSYYLRKPFLNKLYQYYVEQGYYNIISQQLVYILNNSFILFYTLFLVKCVDWHKLITLEEETLLKDCVNMSNMFKLNFYNFILVISYLLYLVIKVGILVSSIYNYKYIKHFYNNILGIGDLDLVNYKWEKIIEKFHKVYMHNDINVYYINNKITIRDNYFISLVDKEIMDLSNLSPLMEWNIKYCFINPIFINDYKYNRDFLYLNKKYITIIKNKLLTVSILNFIFMPILLPFMLLRSLFKYGEKFYNNPGLISSKHWTHYAKWKFRNYNELYHEFHEKQLKSCIIANEYNNQFPIRIISIVCDLFVFILSSFFIMLIIVSVLNEKALTNLYIFKSKNTLWFLGLMATLIAIMRKSMKEKKIYYPDDKLIELKKVINCINDVTIKDKTHKDFFFRLYQFHALTFFYDIYNTLLTPFYLYKMHYNCYNIVKFLSDITIDNPKIGHTNMYSIFNRHENDMKTLFSKETFTFNNPNYDI